MLHSPLLQSCLRTPLVAPLCAALCLPLPRTTARALHRRCVRRYTQLIQASQSTTITACNRLNATMTPDVMHSANDSSTAMLLGKRAGRNDMSSALVGTKKSKTTTISKDHIAKLVSDETHRIATEMHMSDTSKGDMNRLNVELQAVSQQLGVSFDSPEIVVVGMQSDGKSSFIEALLGFQFNLVDSNIGTRRPLIIQMINEPTFDTPVCRFMKEFDESGMFEQSPTPITELSSSIVDRTNAVAGDDEQVSKKPIVLRVQYAQCSNLTIYDTPGFRLRGDENLSSGIMEMVMELIAPKHRLILCLEQSTVEWANSVSRPIVARVDPKFERTILINTKFDNRVKELRSTKNADKYFMGGGIGAPSPVYVSLPLQRNLEPAEFQRGIHECYMADFKHLVSIGYPLDKIHDVLGFGLAKRRLEGLIYNKCRESLRPTLIKLDETCDNLRTSLKQVEEELKDLSLESCVTKVNNFRKDYCHFVVAALEGSIIGVADKLGETADDERESAGIDSWAHSDGDTPTTEKSSKLLFGGSQYRRLQEELQAAMTTVKFPTITDTDQLVATGASSFPVTPAFIADKLVKLKAFDLLNSITENMLQRLDHVFVRLYDLAVLNMYDANPQQHEFELNMFNLVRDKYVNFIGENSVEALQVLQTDLLSFTNLSRCFYENEGRSTGATAAADGSEEAVETADVQQLADELFTMVKSQYTLTILAKVDQMCFIPLLKQFEEVLATHIGALPEERLLELCHSGIKEMRKLKVKHESSLAVCEAKRTQIVQFIGKLDSM